MQEQMFFCSNNLFARAIDYVPLGCGAEEWTLSAWPCTLSITWMIPFVDAMSPVTMWAPSTVRFWKDKRRGGRVWHHGGHGFLVGFHSFTDSGLRFCHGSTLHQSGPDVEFSSGNHNLGTLCCTQIPTSRATWLHWFGHSEQVGLPHLSQGELLSVPPLSHSAVSLCPSGTTCFFSSMWKTLSFYNRTDVLKRSIGMSRKYSSSEHGVLHKKAEDEGLSVVATYL